MALSSQSNSYQPRTVSTGQMARATTLWAVVRSRCVAAPRYPAASRTPNTIKSASSSLAASRIRCAGFLNSTVGSGRHHSSASRGTISPFDPAHGVRFDASKVLGSSCQVGTTEKPHGTEVTMPKPR